MPSPAPAFRKYGIPVVLSTGAPTLLLIGQFAPLAVPPLIVGILVASWRVVGRGWVASL